MDDIKAAARKIADEAWWASPRVSKRFIAAALLEAKAEAFESIMYDEAKRYRRAAAEVRRGE